MAFTNASLGAALDSRQVDRVVVAEMQSAYCVSATCRGALSRRLEVVLASGAHATYDEGESADAISSKVEEELVRAGVKVIPTSRVRFR